MKLEEITIGQLNELKRFLGVGVMPPVKDCPYVVGEKYLIRTVTNYFTGHLTWVGEDELVLESAAWIADTGRFHDCLQNGTLNEVEPIGKVILNRKAIIDASEWIHPLPTVQK